MAALAYIHVALIGIIVSIAILCGDMKKSRYMRFHALQSLFLCVAWIVAFVALSIIACIPFANLLMKVVWPLAGLAWVVFGIILAVMAYNRQELELPVITKMAREQADRMRV
jgi:uncharacterized membrane protein